MSLEFIKNMEDKELEEYKALTAENIIADYKAFLEFLLLLIIMMILQRRYKKEEDDARKRREKIKLKRGYSPAFQI